MFANHLLSLCIWLPILGGVAVLATGDDTRAPRARLLALGFSILTLLATIPLYTGFDASTYTMQFAEGPYIWIKAFDINYNLGIDGISLLMILLTSFTTVLVVIAGWLVIEKKGAQYMAAFLIMEGLLIGVLSALDAILFYVFWEAMLVPMFLIIGLWGGPNRVYAAVKFFLYTFIGSVLMLVAFIYLYFQAGTFDILTLQNLKIGLAPQTLIFFAFFAAFAVKVPMWPVHTWLPDAHVEAPTGGSVVLAAIMLKMGAYGFLRFSLPIVPDAAHHLAWFMITLSLVAVVYIGLVALVQEDMKKLIAYSSIAHMGFVTLGLFVFNAQGIEGGIAQMVSHGFVSGALFLCVGILYDRMHSRMIKDYGGVANKMPVFASFMMLFTMANAGLPGTSGFVGEFLVILGAFEANGWYAFAAATTLIFGAAYSLWMYKRVLFGEVANPHVEELTDVTPRETVFLVLLALAVLVMGLWPYPFLDVMHASVEHLLQQVSVTKL